MHQSVIVLCALAAVAVAGPAFPVPVTHPPVHLGVPGPAIHVPAPGPAIHLPAPGSAIHLSASGPAIHLPAPGPAIHLPAPGPAIHVPVPGPAIPVAVGRSAIPISVTPPVPILRQTAEGPDPVGTYSFSYETGNGIQAQEVGYTNEASAQEAQGSYNYVAPSGESFQVSYVANENGFQPQGAHLPSIPPGIIRALEYIAAHPEENNIDAE